MTLYRVTKIIDFCYGHRLLDYSGKCRHLHGHNGLLEVDIEAGSLNEVGMITDFGFIRDIVKGWIDNNMDHRMILCRHDPVVPMLAGIGEPLYLIDENPTAENIAKHICKQVHNHGLTLSEVRLWETPSSYASYREA